MTDEIETSEAKGGGSAFPHQFEDINGHPRWRQSQGMTLRDWFAGQALVSMGDRRWSGDHSETGTEKQARAAYRIADAMLAAREKGGDA